MKSELKGRRGLLNGLFAIVAMVATVVAAYLFFL